MELKGKTALVTGSAKRVGRQIALTLAREGVNILVHYLTSADDAEKTAVEVRAFGVFCDTMKADLSDPTDVRRLVAAVRKARREPDILVNSASLFYKTPIDEVTEADWDTLMNANLKGPFILSSELGRDMAAAGGGVIINIADWSGFRPYRDYVPYCTSKGGLITLTKALARDLAPKVRANAVAPGPVLLPPHFTEDEKEAVIRRTPLGRIGTPNDVAAAVRFLCESDFINGTVLVVDGGRSIA
jgi:NAD(P)-dependent dehydrogenase (short-subunit alcohol dehydrogenase family)